MHMLSSDRIHSFKSAAPVDVPLNREAGGVRERNEQERRENRNIVETIFDVVRHLAKQNSSFRATDNLEVVMNVYPALLSMFKEQPEQNNDSVATGLLVRLTPFRFVAACLVLVKCFSLSTHASEYLQREDMDLTSGVTAIQDLKATMTSLRTDQQFDAFIKEANSFAEKCGSEVLDVSFSDASPTALQTKRHRRLPTHLADGQTILDMSIQRNIRPDGESELDCFRREQYFPFLDKILSELEKRFSETACEMISLAATFHPRNLTEENVHKVEKIAQFYKLSSHRVGQQFLLFSKSNQCDGWKNAYEKHKNEVKERKEKGSNEKSAITPWVCLPSLLDVFSKDDLHHLYPDLFEVVKIVATLPVTVASCERTHSKVKIINNYLRAAMSPDRLEDLVQISCERDVAANIELSKLVEIFKLAKPRKLPL